MRRQVTVLVAVVSTAIVASFVIPLLLLVQTLAADRGMAVASQQANTVAVLISSLHDDPQIVAALQPTLTGSSAATSAVLADGSVLGEPWPEAPNDPAYQRAHNGEAFSVRDAAGGRVYVPILVDGGVAVARARMTEEQLTDGVPLAWASIIALGVILAGLAVAAAAQVGRQVSRPVLAVADTARRLRAGELTARAPLAGPLETVQLGEALNGLAVRIEELLILERGAVRELAHRLRTPVTALRLESENVPDPESRVELGRLVGLLQASIDDLVREARRPVRDDLPAACDAVTVTSARVAHWTPLAEDQGRQLRVALPTGPVRVALGAADLGDLVDICIDNVFAHTGEGVDLSVTLTRNARAAVLVVDDEGPGFRALPGEPRQGSSGFGLQIVRRVLAKAGGSLHTSAPGAAGGRVELTLPL
ncbi:MAG: ATP-binding protein [Propionicimonas sp.]